MTPRRVAGLFIVLVLAYGAVLSFRRPPEEANRVADEWVVLKDGITVKARPDGVWTLALEWVNGPAVLKFEAGDEEWYYAESDAGKAKADGHLSSLLAAKNTVLPAAPVAALIGKIGGSSAGVNDGTLVVVGKFCLLEIDRSTGPVYLTINDELSGFANNRGAITVRISSRPLPAAPAADKPK
jgi:hypothetical protein